MQIHKDILAELVSGNKRFADGTPEYSGYLGYLGYLRDPRNPAFSKTSGTGTLKHNKPCAAILACSDACTPPDIIFDRGSGDLFVVQTAGNIIDRMILGSIEYAVFHLKTPLIIVLGHTGCSAIEYAINNAEAPESILRVMSTIRATTRHSLIKPGDKIKNAVTANVFASRGKLIQSPIISDAIAFGQAEIITAVYDAETKLVDIIKKEKI